MKEMSVAKSLLDIECPADPGLSASHMDFTGTWVAQHLMLAGHRMVQLIIAFTEIV